MFIRSELITAPTAEQLTLVEAKAHLRVEHSEDDGIISSLITVARQEAEAVTNRRFGAQEWKLYFDSFSKMRLIGCGAISSATIYYRDDAGSWVALNAAMYELVKALPGYINLRDNFNEPDTGDYKEIVRIDVSCGETAQTAIKQWMLLRIGTLYENRESDTVGNVTPNQFADSLLAGYRVIDFA